jgi:ABC-type glycerol-3-phosphate transport system substrate-binding protein
MAHRSAITYLAALLLLVAVLLAQAGCVQITPTPEPATVAFPCPDADKLYCESLAEAFQNEHRHISIELIQPRQYDLSGLDIIGLPPFAQRFLSQADIELLDLTPFIEQGQEFERQDFYVGLIDMFADDEGIWAVPYMVDLDVIYYNRDLFDRYAVAYPPLEWTWDDFVRTAQAMYDPIDGVFGYIPHERHADVLDLIYQNGGRIFDDLGEPTRTTFDEPLTVEAVAWYASLMFEHEAIPTPYQARQAYGITGYIATGIEQGRLGMWMGTLAERGSEAAQAGEINWGIAPMPRGATSAVFASVNGFSILADAEFPDACWEWISFLTRQAPLEGAPPRRSILEGEAFEERAGKDVAAVARASIEHALYLSPAGWDIYGTFQLFDEAMNKVTGGTATALEAMAWAQDRSQYK